MNANNKAKKGASKNAPKPKLRTVAKAIVPKGTFANGGAMLGGLAGPMGSTIGSMLGKGLAAITGFGDYSVKTNTLTTEGLSLPQDSVPQFVTNKHATCIKHREYVGDVIVPVTPAVFTNSTYALNPGNGSLFPWLSSIATNFQQYKLKGCVFEYKTMSSDYASAGPLGTVVLATNYNSNEAPFATKIAMENSEFAVSSKPSMSVIHPIECDPSEQVADILYVRDVSAESASAVSDRRLYDWGNFQIATQGLPGVTGNVMGELWVSYDIELYKPIISPGESSGSVWARWKPPTSSSSQWSAFVFSADVGATSSLVDTIAVQNPNSAVRLRDGSATSYNNLQFLKAGRYSITYKLNATLAADTITAPTFSAGFGGGTPTILYGSTNYANSTSNLCFTGTFDVSASAVGSIMTLLSYPVAVPNVATTYLTVVLLASA